MQLKIGEAFMLVAYGTAINQALANARTKLEDLKVLRDHAVSILAAQGDLKGALSKLEKEIKSRERNLKEKAKKK
jgi:septal ring factor EnvC (AmiA/AmiB activator)